MRSASLMPLPACVLALAWAACPRQAAGQSAPPPVPGPAAAASTNVAADLRTMAQEPPTPPPLAGEQVLLKVFARFPDVNREQVMDFVRDNLPREMNRFRLLAENHAVQAAEYMTQVVGEALDLLRLRLRDPSLYERRMEEKRLERRAEELAELCRAAAGEARERRLAALRETLGSVFEVKQRIMLEELARMEAELAELRGLIDRRSANRELIIDRRLGELTGEGGELRW